MNELEAGYAADGFARVAGISALVTTFGVGELSAINALAGAYAESVPIIHIVGAPPVGAQRGAKLMHHTLGNGDYAVFKHMAESIASCVVDLAEGDDPCGDVDEALEACVITSKPVFIYLPVDLVAKRVKAERLTKPLDLEPPWDQKAAEEFTNMAVAAFESSKRPAILVGHGAMRQKVSISSEKPDIICVPDGLTVSRSGPELRCELPIPDLCNANGQGCHRRSSIKLFRALPGQLL